MSQENVINIVVLVSGTVDPVNMDPVLRSVSYPKPSLVPLQDSDAKQKAAQKSESGSKKAKDDDWYWQENARFRDELRALRKQYTNLHIFEAHGWTGDNSVQARTISGAYLANRLCGAEGETAYYSGHLKKKVHFHFIGHSHGGNVINELTRQAAKVWPKQWKIRTITYLSTPFFTRLHQVDTTTFDDDCKIINAFCKYDITQRVIADFSMHPMTGLMKAAGSEEIGCIARCLSKDMGATPKLFKELMTSVNVSFLKEGTSSKAWKTLRDNLKDGVDWDDLRGVGGALVDDMKKVDIRVAHYGLTEARRFYSHVLGLLARLHDIFTKLREAITMLRDGFTYDVHKSVHPSKKMTRKVLLPATAAKFIQELDRLEGGLNKTKAAFTKRLSKDRFPALGLVQDIHVVEFLKPLITFLSVNAKTLRGPLWDLLASVLGEQVDKFDNTSATPVKQLAGKANSKGRAFTVVPVEVTRADHYTQVRAAAQYDAVFNKFVKRLETIEEQLAGKDLRIARQPLMELLFTLVAHLEPVRDLFDFPVDAEYVSWFSTAMKASIAWKKFWGQTSELELELLRLLTVVLDYAVIIKARNTGKLEVDEAQIPVRLKAFYVAKPAVKEVQAAKKPGGEGASVQGACDCGKHAPKAPQQEAGEGDELKPLPGSIPYFAKVAHSTSRETLHDGVKTALKQQLTTLSKSGR
ncbi:hypothetical protein KYC5002_28060 [Archangium violaceum]|uniref:hypothetical protein n=1 Tax=Archangium violaceum TaxID=83451 RepID=UPI002B2BBA33|nr:hypothetical protein KYC5002_28060 [Archangium gephyra]